MEKNKKEVVFPPIITALQLSKLWRMGYGKTLKTLRYLHAKNIHLGIQENTGKGTWRIQRDKAVECITTPEFQEALENYNILQ